MTIELDCLRGARLLVEQVEQNEQEEGEDCRRGSLSLSLSLSFWQQHLDAFRWMAPSPLGFRSDESDESCAGTFFWSIHKRSTAVCCIGCRAIHFYFFVFWLITGHDERSSPNRKTAVRWKWACVASNLHSPLSLNHLINEKLNPGKQKQSSHRIRFMAVSLSLLIWISSLKIRFSEPGSHWLIAEFRTDLMNRVWFSLNSHNGTSRSLQGFLRNQGSAKLFYKSLIRCGNTFSLESVQLFG